MPSSIASEMKPKRGELISLEGDSHSISTQLRLLPPSQKILILPSLLEDLPEQIENVDLGPRSFIRNVHKALSYRVETALSFIKSSTDSQPRLVFMNGGSVAARSICISYISENCTDGKVGEAEALFNEIVKDGVSGLMEVDDLPAEDEESSEDSAAEDATGQMGNGTDEDHTARAMKAAESLDRDTSALEETRPLFTPVSVRHSIVQSGESNWKPLSQPNTTRPRKTSFGNSDIVRTVVAMPEADTRINQIKRYTIASPFESSLPTPSTIPPSSGYQKYHTVVANGEFEHGLSTSNSSFFSGTSSPQGVIIGEASIVDVQPKISSAPTHGKQLRKAVSIDQFLPEDSMIEDSDVHSRRLQHSKSNHHLRYKPPALEHIQSYTTFQQAREKFSKAPQMTIIRSPGLSSNSSPCQCTTTRAYVHQGTDAREEIVEKMVECAPLETLPFRPVFPIIEDLVIHFIDGSPSPILDSAVASYKNGTYPSLPETASRNTLPSPTNSNISMDDIVSPVESHFTNETDDEDPFALDEFDPYSSNAPQWPRNYTVPRTDMVLEPSTPSITPRPISNKCAEKFHTFSPLDVENVIVVQNSLRAVLALYFSKDMEGYTQHVFPVVPEADRFWKPVFNNNEDASTQGNETVDQIIALGCEEGVKQDIFFQISGQVERLGMKRDGSNRSGRLDLRYLIANAMQTLSTLPSKSRSKPNPLADPALLATLLVPHLEAYLAANTAVRLLILLYPADHLSTIISLRTLVGQKLFKIAGILDSLASDPPCRPRPRTPNASHPLSNESLKLPKPPLSYRNRSRTTSSFAIANSPTSPTKIGPSQIASFSKADYLLPSIATDSEIANFLSGIWASLMEESDYYTPEPELEPIIVEKVIERFIEKPSLPPTPTSPYPPVPHRPSVAARNSSAKIARLTGSEAQISIPIFGGPEKGGYAASIASTTMTMRTTASRRWKRESIGDGLENFYLGEEDSEEDDWDRMIMGRAGAKPAVKAPTGKTGVGSKKKALKWLGLA